MGQKFISVELTSVDLVTKIEILVNKITSNWNKSTSMRMAWCLLKKNLWNLFKLSKDVSRCVVFVIRKIHFKSKQSVFCASLGRDIKMRWSEVFSLKMNRLLEDKQCFWVNQNEHFKMMVSNFKRWTNHRIPWLGFNINFYFQYITHSKFWFWF